MIPLVLAYIGSIVLKALYEMLDYMQENKVGVKGWWDVSRIATIKKGVIHVPLCAAWVSGGALAAVNAMSASVGLGTFEAVSVVNTVMAAWFLDSASKPMVKRLKKAGDGD